MKTKTAISTFLFLLLSWISYGQISFQAEVSKKSIGINQRIEVRFTMNEDGDNFSPPNFENFQVVGGPMQSYSTTWVNRNRSFKKSFTYYLVPKKKGTLTIGSASVEINGKTYKTDNVTITVGDAVAEPAPAPRNQGWYGFFGDDDDDVQPIQTPPQNIGKGIFLVAEVSNNNPYVNEPISVVYKLYVSHESGIKGMQLLNTPKFTNFWNHTVPEKDMQVKLEKYKGKEYRMAVVQKTVLMPQKDGKLSIDPLEFEMLVEEATGRYYFTGSPEMVVSKKTYSTGTKVIQVKPLPLEGQPTNFTGAVGNFSFTAKANKTQVKANEPIELTVTATGKGNLQLFSLPKAVASEALELYDPELKETINNHLTSGMEGSKSEKYVIVPQYKGTYKIEPLSFSYFDPSSKKYITVTTPEIPIEVTQGPEIPKEKIANDRAQVLHDIFSKATFEKEKKSVSFLGSITFYALLFSPLYLIPLLIVADRKRKKQLANTTGIKSKHNQRLAKKYLGEAKKKIGNKEAFYEALERCLHNYLKARLHIETTEMSHENITSLLDQKNISDEAITRFISLKSTCEMARYSPFDVQTMKNDFEKAVEIISDFEKQFKA